MERILIIEDDPRIAQNISRGLQQAGYRTAVCHDGLAGQTMALAEPVDLLILDLNLPTLNGAEVCRAVRQAKPHLPIIMLTAYGEIEDKVTGLEQGADDYIVKPFDLRELTARVGTCLRRVERLAAPFPDEQLRVADLVLNLSSRQVYRGNRRIELTAKEFNLLETLMRNEGRILSKAELTERVWKLHFDPGTNVVEVYINYLRKKVDRDYTPRLIHTRPGLGYVLTVEM